MVNKQLVCNKIGKSGCYFLSLVFIAEKLLKKSIDVVELYVVSVAKNWMGEDCFMNNPAAMLSYVIGKTVDVKHAGLDYQLSENEYEITRYELRETGITFAHFVVTLNGEIIYDPYGESRTRKHGIPVSKRIIKVAA